MDYTSHILYINNINNIIYWVENYICIKYKYLHYYNCHANKPCEYNSFIKYNNILKFHKNLLVYY